MGQVVNFEGFVLPELPGTNVAVKASLGGKCAVVCTAGDPCTLMLHLNTTGESPSCVAGFPLHVQFVPANCDQLSTKKEVLAAAVSRPSAACPATVDRSTWGVLLVSPAINRPLKQQLERYRPDVRCWDRPVKLAARPSTARVLDGTEKVDQTKPHGAASRPQRPSTARAYVTQTKSLPKYCPTSDRRVRLGYFPRYLPAASKRRTNVSSTHFTELGAKPTPPRQNRSRLRWIKKHVQHSGDAHLREEMSKDASKQQPCDSFPTSRKEALALLANRMVDY